MNDKNGVELKVLVDKSEIDETLEKVERLHSLLKETNALLNELALKGSLGFDVRAAFKGGAKPYV